MAGTEAALEGAAAAALAGGAEIQAWALISVLIGVLIRVHIGAQISVQTSAPGIVPSRVPVSVRWTAGKEIIGIGSALGKNAGRHTCWDFGVRFVRLIREKIGVNVYAPLLWREHFRLSE